MLVLTRKMGEGINIDNNIKIRIVKVKGKQVRLGIDAPKNTKIHREEIHQAIQSQNKMSTQVDSKQSRAVATLLKQQVSTSKEI